MNYEACPLCGEHHETSGCRTAGARCAVAACSPADQPESERLAFLLGWRWAEKRRPRTPNPFTGIDRALELMWDAGYEEGQPENVEMSDAHPNNPDGPERSRPARKTGPV